MAQFPPEKLRARPDFYIIRLKKKIHAQTVKARIEAVRLHGAYTKEIKRVGKSDLSAVQKTRSFVRIADEFSDRFEERLRKRVNATMEFAAEDAHAIMNLCLPKGVEAPGEPVVPDYWDKKMWGSTPEERLALARLKLRKKMGGALTRKMQTGVAKKIADIEAFPGEDYELAVSTWESTESIITSIAGNEPWLGGLLAEMSTFESDVDVIDHYEFLATLDELTCDECGALDGTVYPDPMEGLDIDSDVSVHPNCRCVLVPVTKTWEELGLEPMAEPEGTRIARSGYPIDTESGRDWGKSSPGPDSVQGYVPADTRWEKWKGRK